ncbi:SbtR family transcriptional regulator [Streptomyces massasporeus]
MTHPPVCSDGRPRAVPLADPRKRRTPVREPRHRAARPPLQCPRSASAEGMPVALESIMATGSPVFDDARTRMDDVLTRLLDAGSAVGTVCGDVTGPTLLRALGGICATGVSEGWLDEAHQFSGLLLDGLRHGAPRAT